MPVQRRKYTFRARDIPCTFPGCRDKFSTVSGRKRHLIHHTPLALGQLNASSLHTQAQTQNPLLNNTPPDETPPLDESGDASKYSYPHTSTARSQLLKCSC